MTETKKIDTTFTDADGDDLRVKTENEVLGAYVLAESGGVYVSADDAPAVALAILEAAGHDATTGPSTSYMTARAVRNLREGLRMKAAREAREADKAAQAEAEAKAQAEREAADAADLAALDREALALFNAHRAAVGDYPLAELPNPDRWRAVARAARAQSAAPAPRIKPTWEIVDRTGLPARALLINNETRRAWPFRTRVSAEKNMGWILEDPRRGVSYDFDHYGLS